MPRLGTINITGESGSNYEFEVYPKSTRFNRVGAVYLVSRRTPKSKGGASHSLLYAGETGDLSTRFADHHKGGCFDARRANSICVHLRSSEESRLEIEQDILKNGTNWPCND